MAQWIVFGVFTAFAAVMLYVGASQHFAQRRLLERAVPVSAKVTVSEVRGSTSHDTDRRLNRSTSTTSYTPEVRFRYSVGGTEHESDLLRPSIIVRGYASQSAAREELLTFPVGAQVTAYVDPDLPDRAFLIREPSNGPLVFLIVGALIPVIAWFGCKLI